VAEFRVFNSNRQRIAHGKDHKLDAFPTSECQALLRRYVRLVTTHDWDNS
jgi:hypothetical protein